MTFGGGGSVGFFGLDEAAAAVPVAAAAVGAADLGSCLCAMVEAGLGRGGRLEAAGGAAMRACPGCAGSWCASEDGPVASVDAMIV